jgi:hypothetical protein
MRTINQEKRTRILFMAHLPEGDDFFFRAA